MLATGGSSIAAINILLNSGVKEENIIFICIICASYGLQIVQSTFPKIKIIYAVQDEALNAQKYIVPGLGDFGDRYFGTL